MVSRFWDELIALHFSRLLGDQLRSFSSSEPLLLRCLTIISKLFPHLSAMKEKLYCGVIMSPSRTSASAARDWGPDP